jgi:hypothetical protein
VLERFRRVLLFVRVLLLNPLPAVLLLLLNVQPNLHLPNIPLPHDSQLSVRLRDLLSVLEHPVLLRQVRRRLRFSRDGVPRLAEGLQARSAESSVNAATDLRGDEFRAGDLGLSRVADEDVQTERGSTGRGVTLRGGERSSVLFRVVRLNEGGFSRLVARRDSLVLDYEESWSVHLLKRRIDSGNRTVVVENVFSVCKRRESQLRLERRKGRSRLTSNESRSHDLEHIPRAHHRHRPTLQIPTQPPQLDQAILLRLITAQLVNKGVTTEEVERVAEAGAAGGVDGEEVDFVRVGAEGGGESVNFPFATCEPERR